MDKFFNRPIREISRSQTYCYLVVFQKACRRLHRQPRPLLHPLQPRQQVRDSNSTEPKQSKSHLLY